MSEDKEEAIKIEGISINKVKSDYKPFLAVAFCWTDNGEKGLFYDYVQPSFAVHPCDLFDEKGNREEWRDLKEYTIENCKDMLPEKAKYLRKNIAGRIQVSNFGRVGIPINCHGNSGLCKGCKGCTLKCKKFHFILPQYENRFWNDSEEEFKTYNGYLIVNKRYVYELVAEAFEMKEKTFQKMKEDNKVLKNYIKEKCGFDNEEELKKAFESLKNANELQIHHIDNNGHHNTPTYWKNGKIKKGNLIALPESIHQKIHGKS